LRRTHSTKYKDSRSIHLKIPVGKPSAGHNAANPAFGFAVGLKLQKNFSVRIGCEVSRHAYNNVILFYKIGALLRAAASADEFFLFFMRKISFKEFLDLAWASFYYMFSPREYWSCFRLLAAGAVASFRPRLFAA
jgi:hypothetical protein